MASQVTELLKHGFEGFAHKPLDGIVQELADREEIRELVARYAQRVSRRLSPADLFTDDGSFIIRMPGLPVQEAHGREQLEKTFTAVVTGSGPLTMPAIHNQVIFITGDEALGTSWIELYGSSGGGRNFVGTGYYEDKLRRENGRWKFVVRDANVLVAGPLPQAPSAGG